MNFGFSLTPWEPAWIFSRSNVDMIIHGTIYAYRIAMSYKHTHIHTHTTHLHILYLQIFNLNIINTVKVTHQVVF